MMKSALFSFLAAFLLFTVTMATNYKAIVVSYPNDTPNVDRIVADAKKQIVENGGEITHEYSIIHGFAANVPISDTFSTTMQTWEKEHGATVEEDAVMHTMEGS
jgi:hypothetical protein